MSFETISVNDVEDDIVTVMWMPDGLPLFIADREDICDVVESMGFSIYYLLANKSETKSVTTKTNGVSKTTNVTTTNGEMFKVVTNIVGRSVSVANEMFPENVVTIAEQAEYIMPAIPNRLIEKLDEFFRLVDAQHGTESIVLLTYDTTCQGSDGWGILVPDQTNTSVHCNYDPTSVIEHKPENALIVGSVHSHPGMAAYASGTDHSDQADFDGIHITFGWQKSVNNGATQYHIEMQMAGSAYTLRPEDVFENIVSHKDPDPEVVAWTENVKKVLPPHRSTGAGVTQAASASAVALSPASQTTSTTKTPDTTRAGTRNRSKTKSAKPFSYAVDAPSAWKLLGPEAIVLAEIVSNNIGTYDCPGCGYDLTLNDVNLGECDWCHVPLILKSDAENNTLDDILSDLAYWCYKHDYSLDVHPYLWITANGENTIMPLTQDTLRTSLINHSGHPSSSSDSSFYHTSSLELEEAGADEYDPDDDDEYGRHFSSHHLMCCGLRIEDAAECDCVTQITPNDVTDFDEYTSRVSMYAPMAVCNSCKFYYSTACPGFRNALLHFVEDRSLSAEDFANVINGEDCAMYELYEAYDDYDPTVPYYMD